MNETMSETSAHLAAQHRTHGLHNGTLLNRAGAHGGQQGRVAAAGCAQGSHVNAGNRPQAWTD